MTKHINPKQSSVVDGCFYMVAKKLCKLLKLQCKDVQIIVKYT